MSKPSRRHHNPTPHPLTAEPPEWEVVWRGVAETEATITAGRLEADGIRVQMDGARKEFGLLAGSFDHGDYAILVPSSHAGSARSLLTRYGEGKNVIARPLPEGERSPAAIALMVTVLGLLVIVLLVAILFLAQI